MNFKKFSGRVTAVAATMAVVASMSVISASAADYGTTPSYSAPDTSLVGTGVTVTPTTYQVSSDDVVSGSGNVRSVETPSTAESTTDKEDTSSTAVSSSNATILTSESVSTAINDAANSGEGEAVIEMASDKKGGVTLKEDTLAAIANSDVVVTIVTASSSGIEYAISIDPAEIANVDGSVNVGMNIEKPSKNAKVDGVPVPKNSLVIAPKAKGGLGMNVAVTLPASALNGMKANKVAVFAVDKNGNVVKLEDAIVFNDDGSFTINVDGSVDLIISDKDIVKAAAKTSNKSTKATGARPGTGKGVAALGLIDASAISAAAILSKKKKKK